MVLGKEGILIHKKKKETQQNILRVKLNSI
jgi:hypothetical protein